jgi:aryl-alcohol dehydrogenase-like predicted oxidoreductase
MIMLQNGSNQILEKRHLGNTSILLPIIGFGASPLGGVFGEINPQEAINAVHYAYEHGINFFDTSPYYGLGKSEELLGQALKNLSRHDIILSTKIGRYGEKDFDFSAKKIKQSLEQSMNRLQTDYFDLILCHDIEFGSIQQIIEETIPALQDYKNKGIIKAIGASAFPLSVLNDITQKTHLDFILSYCHYNLLNNKLKEFIEILKNPQLGIINASPLYMGLLSEHDIPSWHPATPLQKNNVFEAKKYAKKHGLDITKIATYFAINNNFTASTFIGLKTVEEVKKALDAVYLQIQHQKHIETLYQICNYY